MSEKQNNSSSGRRYASASRHLSQNFINGEGIDREVISADICRYLGDDALVRPGDFLNPETRQHQDGFYITAYRPPTSVMLADLRADSQKWREEKARQSTRYEGGYEQSATQQQSRMREDHRIERGRSSIPFIFADQMTSSTTASIGVGPAGHKDMRVQFSTPNYTRLPVPPSYQPKPNLLGSLQPLISEGYSSGGPPSDYDYVSVLPSRFPFGKGKDSDRTAGSGYSLGDINENNYDNDGLIDLDELATNTTPHNPLGARDGWDRDRMVNNDNSTSKYIRDTILANAIPKDHIFTIRCQVDWDLAQYCKEQLNGNMSLRRVLTITGSPERAQAASCEDYVRQTWGERYLELLDAIVTGYDKESVEFFNANSVRLAITRFKLGLSNPGKFEMSVSGVLEDVVRTITFFAWLAATFRLPEADGLTTFSKVDFQYDDGSVQDGFARSGGFQLSLCLPKQEIEMRKPNTSSGACWLPLFQGGVISCGFPVANREEGEGLEIPFELLRLLAGVKGSMEYEGVAVYVGPSRILFPTKILHGAVQWHYVESNDKQVLVDALNAYKCRDYVKDISILETFRVFLGSYKYALVYAGTQEGIESSQIHDSGAPKSSSRLELAKEFTLTGLAQIAAPGGSISLGAKLVLPRPLQVSLDGVRDYYSRLESSSQRPILVYDLSARSAWLVSELSMVLHMVHKYLSLEKLQSRRQHSKDQMPWRPLPFAKPSADAGKEAYLVIQDSGHFPLYTRHEDGKLQEFWNEIDTLLKAFGTIRTQDYIKKSSAGWKLRKPRLQGWDFNDLATKEETVFQRELPSDIKKSSWWSLAEVDDMVILFGRDFGQIIRPDLARTQPYRGWESIPGQAELLTASMPCVRRLASKCNSTGSCEKLTPELFWHKPTSRSCTGDFTTCSDGCLYVQELRNQALFNTSLPNPPGKRLCRNDAVIFGEIKYYHEAMREGLSPD